MSVIYLKHPVHGTKVATMELEAVADEANGWQRFDPEPPQETPQEADNVLPMREKRKYTRRA